MPPLTFTTSHKDPSSTKSHVYVTNIVLIMSTSKQDLFVNLAQKRQKA